MAGPCLGVMLALALLGGVQGLFFVYPLVPHRHVVSGFEKEILRVKGWIQGMDSHLPGNFELVGRFPGRYRVRYRFDRKLAGECL